MGLGTEVFHLFLSHSVPSFSRPSDRSAQGSAQWGGEGSICSVLIGGRELALVQHEEEVFFQTFGALHQFPQDNFIYIWGGIIMLSQNSCTCWVT